MSYKYRVNKSVYDISYTEKTVVNFPENVEFTLVPEESKSEFLFHIEDIKGDFEFDSVSGQFLNLPDENKKFLYCSSAKTFICDSNKYHSFVFSYLKITALPHDFNVNIDFSNFADFGGVMSSMRSLQVHDNTERYVYPYGYGNFRLRCCIKRISILSQNDIEIFIVIPDGFLINGKKGIYRELHSSVAFSPVSISIDKSYDFHTIAEKPTKCEQVPSEVHKEEEDSKLYKMMSNTDYADVVLIASDGTEIKSHRNFLSFFSKPFADRISIYNELPVRITVEEFGAEIVKASLNFLYDKPESICGKETEVFKFADKFEIVDLIKACCDFFEKSVDETNVCEFLQIAHTYKIEVLKEKCKKVLIEKKKDVVGLDKLPNEILLIVVDYLRL